MYKSHLPFRLRSGRGPWQWPLSHSYNTVIDVSYVTAFALRRLNGNYIIYVINT